MTSSTRRIAGFVGLVTGLALGALVPTPERVGATEPNRAALATAYSQSPLRFEANEGQADPEARFVARGDGYTLFLTPAEAVVVLRHAAGPSSPVSRDCGPVLVLRCADGSKSTTRSVLRMTLAGADPDAVLRADTPSGVANYFIGRDPVRWRRNVPTYARVRVSSVYPGVDVVYYGTQRQLEYDFVVAPGTDPRTIRLAFTGVDDVRTNERGDLVLHAGGGDVLLRKPEVYQDVNGTRHEVDGRYRVAERDTAGAPTLVSFAVAAYDVSRPLVIDPILSYAALVGGTGVDTGTSIAVDASGAAYIAGFTDSIDFPFVGGVLGNQGGTDAFVTKLSADGNTIVYSTYLGGGGTDKAWGIAVDSSGNAYVVGQTDSTDFPATVTGFEGHQVGTDAFVAKLSAGGGALTYATYLGGGGEDVAYGIAVDNVGHAWVTGYTDSPDFPTVNPFQTAQGGRDAFIAELDTTKSNAASLVYSTYLGTSARDEGHAIAVDSTGNVYVTGLTLAASGFPTSANAKQAASGGGMDAFVTELNAAGSAILYSTYYGGNGDDAGLAIAIDSVASCVGATSTPKFPCVYVAGSTDSTNLTLKASFQTDQGGTDAFVAKFNPVSPTTSSLSLATYIGGSGTDAASGIAVNGEGAVIVTGATNSSDFPVTDALQAYGGGTCTPPGGVAGPCFDAFVFKLNAKLGGASSLMYSTYLGGAGDDAGAGIALDALGNAYIVGATQSSGGFPGASGTPLIPTGLQNAFVAKLAQPDLSVSALTVATVTPGAQVTVTDTVVNLGDVPAPGTTVRYFFSTDLTLGNADDVLLGSRAVPALAAKATSTATTTLTTNPLPSGLAPGPYFVFAVVDPDNTIAESLEANNKRATTIPVGPNLVVSALSFTPPSGLSLSVTDTTKNSGGSAAVATTTSFVLSPKLPLTGANTSLGTRAVPALAPGASDTATTALTIPGGMTPGDYSLIAQADFAQVIVESSETDNSTTASKSVSIRPDLTVSVLNLSGPGGAGKTITLTDTTTNIGATTAVASTTRFYLSTDGTAGTGDVVLGSRSVPQLDPGATSVASTDVVIPADTPVASLFVIAVADADNVVTDETNKGNNSKSRTLRVGPDLAVSFVGAPSSANPGATINLTDTTKNIGGGDAPATTTRYVLTTDGTVRTTDPVLLNRSVPALAAGAQSIAPSTPATVPAATAPGSYVIVAIADADNAVDEPNETNNTKSAAITVIGPDLTVSSLTVPPKALSGTISVTDTTANPGTGPAPASVTKFYLSSDTTVHPTDPLLGSRNIPTLSAKTGTSTGTTTLTIPANTAAGSYFVVAFADADGLIGESNENNNTSAQPIAIGPDLAITSFTAPAVGGANLTISVTDTTASQGAGTAAASTTRFYLSTDATFDPSDVMIGSRQIPALDPGTVSTASTTLTIPANTATGNYFVIAVADADGAVSESNEANNIATSAIAIGPDLFLNSFSVTSKSGAGQTIFISDNTKNIGGGAAPASTTRFILTTDGTVRPTDPVLLSRSVPALAPGAFSSPVTSATVPDNTPVGNYVVVAIADADNAVVETNETNNTRTAPITIGADLSIAAVTGPTAAGANATITIGDTTRNVGGSAIPSTRTAFYLSASSTLDASKVLLGSRTIPALGANAINTGTISVTVPAATAAGSYFIIAQADADGIITELDESNNTRSKAIDIGPDLSVTLLSGPTTAAADSVISVSDTTKNSGAGAAPASITNFYLAATTTLSPSDTWIGSRNVPALASGVSSAATTSVHIPAGVGGSFFIIAKADGPNQIAEVDETNNTRSRAITIGPDLVVTLLTAPVSTGAGSTIAINETTKNSSTVAAPASTTAYYLSTDTTLHPTDPQIGSRSVPALNSGISSAVTGVLVNIPPGTASGNYFIIAKADAGNVIAERDESDNTKSRAIQIGPDLIVSTFSTTPTITAATATISITDTTANQGGGQAAASSTKFFLSTDGTLGTATLLGSRSVPALDPGTTSTGTISVTVPPGTPAGSYTIIAFADGDGTVQEISETNNTAIHTLLIGPDLTVSSLTVPVSATAGTDISIADTTKNIGADTAGPSTTQFILSTDGTVAGAVATLGTRAVGSLASGASSAGTTSVTIPAGTVPGSYFIVGIADSTLAVPEFNETDNTRSKAITIQ